MSNSDIYIDTFKKIEAFLQKEVKGDNYAPFSEMVKFSKNKIISRYKDELLSFAKLRNAIVHTPKIDGKTIAEPHDAVVKEIMSIYDKITNPKKVIPTFQLADVLGAKKDDFINDILVKMHQFSFSQFPIFNEQGNVEELMTTNTITRWLSTQLETSGTLMTENVTIEQLMGEIEYTKNYTFVSRDCTIYDAYCLFMDHIQKYKRNLDAIFITQNGKSNNRLLGIITIEDIADKV